MDTKISRIVDFAVKISQRHCKCYQYIKRSQFDAVYGSHNRIKSHIIGSYFFKDAANFNATMNGERYRKMMSNFFLHKMEELDLHDMWYQQDGA